MATLLGCSAAAGSGGRSDGSVGVDAPSTSSVDAGNDDEEICGNGLDDDRNGRADDGCGCELGETQSCYPGDPSLAGVGACTLGRQTCIDAGGVEFGTWGPCVGAEPPGAEACNGVDDDCDGVADEACECELGATRACYDGPDGTRGAERCDDGVEQCVAGPGGVGSGWSGSCVGSVGPREETCDGTDDDCDGAVDEGCGCAEGLERPSGREGTEGVGPCRAGIQRCSVGADGAASWSACEGDVLPATDACCHTASRGSQNTVVRQPGP